MHRNFSKEVSEKKGLEKSRSRCVDNIQTDITGRVCGLDSCVSVRICIYESSKCGDELMGSIIDGEFLY